MDAKDIRNLSEAYMEVYNNELDEGFKEFPSKKVYKQALKKPTGYEGDAQVDAMMNTRADFKNKTYDLAGKAKAKEAANRARGEAKRAAGKKKTFGNRLMRNEEQGYDIYDIILSHLLDEGYAETVEAAEVIMVNMSEEQLDEISQKLATKAYAERRTGEFEGDDSPERIAKTDKLEKRIKKKFGEKAAAHADEAAAVKTFGRKDASGRRKQSPKPRIEKSDYRTTQDGKMHKQDQKELKTELRIKRDRRLRAARAADTNEQVDIYDIILLHLLDEGYAETVEAAEVIMVNMSEEWRSEVISEASSRDEFTRAAIARNSGRKGGITFEPGPNWDPSANRGKGAHLSPKQKEKQRRKALRQEDFELWVNSLVEEGYDLSDYTWSEMYDIYEGEKPFPYEKVSAQQKKHTAAGRYGNMMKMGLAKRRAKEAEKTGGSQQDAGKGWYHGR